MVDHENVVKFVSDYVLSFSFGTRLRLFHSSTGYTCIDKHFDIFCHSWPVEVFSTDFQSVFIPEWLTRNVL